MLKQQLAQVSCMSNKVGAHPENTPAAAIIASTGKMGPSPDPALQIETSSDVPSMMSTTHVLEVSQRQPEPSQSREAALSIVSQTSTNDERKGDPSRSFSRPGDDSGDHSTMTSKARMTESELLTNRDNEAAVCSSGNADNTTNKHASRCDDGEFQTDGGAGRTAPEVVVQEKVVERVVVEEKVSSQCDLSPRHM